MRKSYVLLLITLLLASVAAQYTITASCISCSTGLCIQNQGGPFNNYQRALPGISDCDKVAPSAVSFTCDPSCSQSCGITVSQNSQSVSTCANTT